MIMMKDENNGPDQCGGATLRDYLELMRLPNVFTSMADVAMGFLFVRELTSAIDAWLLAVLLASSSLLYLAGVVLNDVFDLELDSHERPDRPLPSGRISPSAARWFGWGLLFAGAVLGWTAAFLIGNILPGAIVVILVTGILIYDAGMKFTAIGPVLMGLPHVQRAIWHERGRGAFYGRTLGRGRRYWSLYRRNHLVCQDRKHPQFQAAIGAFHSCDDVRHCPFRQFALLDRAY